MENIKLLSKSKLGNRESLKLLIDYAIAFLPAMTWGMIYFGVRFIYIPLLAALTGGALEYAFSVFAEKKYDSSVIVNSLIVSMTLSVSGGAIYPLVAGVAVFGLSVLRRYLPSALTLSPAVFALALMSVLNLHTLTPADHVTGGSLPIGVSVLDLLIGKHYGGFGSVSVIFMLLGFVYLSVRKRVKILPSIFFIASFVLTLSLVYNYIGAGDGITSELFFMTYSALDGSVIFASLFLLTSSAVLPQNGYTSVAVSAIGGALSVLLIFGIDLPMWFADLDIIYVVLSVMSICAKPLDMLIEKIKHGSSKRQVK